MFVVADNVFLLILIVVALQNETTNVVININSRELLMMGIVVPETCWAYKKYNKIICGIKLVFYSSVITMMHGPTNIRCAEYVV